MELRGLPTIKKTPFVDYDMDFDRDYQAKTSSQ